MNKFLLALPGIMLLSAASVFAQATLYTIDSIQYVSPSRLAACDDAPTRVNDTVRVRGIVITPGSARPSTSTPATRQVWIRDLNSDQGFHNITLFATVPTAPDDILNMVPGDTVEVEGTVLEFNGTAGEGETEIAPFADKVTIIGTGTGPAPTSTLLANVGILNDAQRVNNLPTGEQWEGGFVEIQNVVVVAVTLFGAGRVSFTVADAVGNRVEISDRFAAGRPPGFVAPNVGDSYTSIKGIVIHNKNFCAGSASTNRGYTLNPFDASHYVKGAQAPTISALGRSIVSPCSTDVVTIQATITDDGSVSRAVLYYALNTSTSYDSVVMTAGAANAYTATIPAQTEGTLVKYYIRAVDNNGQVTSNPNVPNNSPSAFYTVRCGAPQVRDIQYTPFADGNSGYRNMVVTAVEGIVTADASQNNLGQVYMQQAGQSTWAGIWLVGGPTIASLRIGDLVRVTGTVEEDFNVTRINVTASNVVSSGNTIAATNVDPDSVTAYKFSQNEAYEGMLIRVANPASGQNLTVVDTNTAPGTSNFGEWRLGADPFDPNRGVVVHTGYRNNTNYSSLSVSYINSLRRWRRALVDSNSAVLINMGDQFSSATGILYYGFSLLKLLPRTNEDLPGYIVSVKNTIGNGGAISLRPNPASGRAVLSIGSAALNAELKDAAYRVTTVLGNSVKISGRIAGENTAIDISTLAPGMYNLIVTGRNATVTKKLVVE